MELAWARRAGVASAAEGRRKILGYVAVIARRAEVERGSADAVCAWC
jgi:hypothetical protein